MQCEVQPPQLKNYWQQFDNGMEYARTFVIPHITHEVCRTKSNKIRENKINMFLVLLYNHAILLVLSVLTSYHVIWSMLLLNTLD